MKASRVKRTRGRDDPPVATDRPSEYLFNPGPRLRKMRVILDRDSLSVRAGGEQIDYLLGLLHHESILTWRYSDDGPPDEVERMTLGGSEAAVGWIKVLSDDGFVYSDGERISHSGLHFEDASHLAEDDQRDTSYAHLDAANAAKQRVADIRLLEVGQAANIDLIISDRPYLHTDPFKWVSRNHSEVVTPKDALALVGLYLRAQHHYVVDVDPTGKFQYTYNKGLMTWVASRALLPEGWRWMSACVQHSSHTGDDTFTHYAGTAHHRLERALLARDELFLALNQPQNNDTADDAMAALDNLLINLSAALDVTARVMNEALGPHSPPHLVGWRRPGWLNQIKPLDADVGRMIDDADFKNLIAILSELRNTIHGAALDSLAVSEGMSMKRHDTLVGLPAHRLELLLEAMDHLGGRELWGVKELIPGRAHAEVDVLCERLMAMVSRALNRIMKLTPVEALEGVSLTADKIGPDEGPQSAFKSKYRHNILLQYGLVAS